MNSLGFVITKQSGLQKVGTGFLSITGREDSVQ